jgi:hypothetical protein
MGVIKAVHLSCYCFAGGSDAGNNISGDPRIGVGSKGKGGAFTDVGLFGSIVWRR